MHASIGRGSGTIALASAHTSCLRQIVKEQSPTEAAGRPGSITPVPRALQASLRGVEPQTGVARIISAERLGTSPGRKKIPRADADHSFDHLSVEKLQYPAFSRLVLGETTYQWHPPRLQRHRSFAKTWAMVVVRSRCLRSAHRNRVADARNTEPPDPR